MKCFCLLLAGILVATAAAKDEWVPLFDGKTLDGWHTQPGGTWKVENGAIRGTSPSSEKRHGLLVSDDTYSDFTVRLKFRVTKGDSGFYFRSKEMPTVVAIRGFQVEVDSSAETGGLYETAGRAWVAKPDPKFVEKVYHPGEWSTLELQAEGPHLLVKINGTKITDIVDEKGARSGHFALQLHGGMEMEVEYKDIEIRESKAD